MHRLCTDVKDRWGRDRVNRDSLEKMLKSVQREKSIEKMLGPIAPIRFMRRRRQRVQQRLHRTRAKKVSDPERTTSLIKSKKLNRQQGHTVVVDEREVVRGNGEHLRDNGHERRAVDDRVERGLLKDGAVGLDGVTGVGSGGGQWGVGRVKLADPGNVERSRRVGRDVRSDSGGSVVGTNDRSGVLPGEIDGVTGDRDRRSGLSDGRAFVGVGSRLEGVVDGRVVQNGEGRERLPGNGLVLSRA